MNNPDHILKSIKTIFVFVCFLGIKILKFLDEDLGFGIWDGDSFGSGIWYGKKSDSGSGIHIPDPQHSKL